METSRALTGVVDGVMNDNMNKRIVVFVAIAVALGLIAWRLYRTPEIVRDLVVPGKAAEKHLSRDREEPGRDGDPGAPMVNERTRPSQPPPERVYPKPKPEIPVAEAVQGKPGFVLSPFNSKVVDVRDIPPGTLVADPTYPMEEKKFFRVPEPAPETKKEAPAGK
jgi:hypothetical protein